MPMRARLGNLLGPARFKLCLQLFLIFADRRLTLSGLICISQLRRTYLNIGVHSVKLILG